MSVTIPEPSLRRLCACYQILEHMAGSGKKNISSAELGLRLGASAHIVRKDISYLSEARTHEMVGDFGSGYETEKLKTFIARSLGFDIEKLACIAGLGRLGSAIMNYQRLLPAGFRIVAGFDSNINRIEMMKTEVELFPSHEIEEVVKMKGIECGIIAVPAEAAGDVCTQLIRGGVKGIINFAPVILSAGDGEIIIHNVDIINDLRLISAQLLLRGLIQDARV